MAKIKANSLTLYYEQTSKDKPHLIFISGLACDHSMWNVEHFTKHFSVLVFDNRGVGQSEVPGRSYEMQDMADDTAALCRALGIKKGYFVGHSMGGHILQYLAASYPELVERAVIACSEQQFSILSYLATKMEVELLRCNVPRRLVVENYLPFLFSPHFLQQKGKVNDFVESIINEPHPQTIEGYLGQLEAIRKHDTTAILSQIRCPTLVIGCEEDLLTPYKNSEYLKAHIPNAKLAKITGCGHLPNMEKPEEFYSLIASFLK